MKTTYDLDGLHPHLFPSANMQLDPIVLSRSLSYSQRSQAASGVGGMQ